MEPRRGVGPWAFALVVVGVICMIVPTAWGGQALARKSRMSNDLLDLMNYTAAELSVAQADGTWPAEAPPIGEDRRVVVDVYVISQDDVPEAMTQLLALGFEVTGQMNTIISGWIPIDSLPAVENIPEVQNCIGSNRMAHAGRVMSEGDKAMQTDKIRSQLGLTGKGITIAVLSDSYNTKGGAAADIASGDLPSDIEVVADWTGSASDEGRAMLQLIHDCAPEAKLTFHHVWGGIAQFAQGIQSVAGCPAGSATNCKPAKRPAQVIVDDVIYFGEPFFQDGLVAQAVDLVTKAGIVYLSAAGNYARQAWEGTAKLTGQKLASGRWANFLGGWMHDFSGTGTYYQRIKVPAQGQMWFTFQWQQPFVSVGGGRGTASDWDAYLFEDTNNDGVPDKVAKWATIRNERGDAVEYLGHKSPYNVEKIFYLALVLYTGVQTNTERLKWINTGAGTPMDFVTNSPTLFGHANAETAIAVAAASARQTPMFGYNPAVAEAFTALGATRIYFDIKNNPVDLLRSHPDVTGPDGTLNTFFGGGLRFYGTSAAAPHVAALTACMLQAKPCLTPAQVRQVLRDTALDMKDPFNPTAVGYDWVTGAGFVNAVAATNTAASMLCSSCPLVFVWKSMPDAASTAEDLVVNVLVSCSVALGQGYTILWTADLFSLTAAMGSTAGKLIIPKATLATRAGSTVKLTVKLTKGTTIVTDSVSITLGAPPQLCNGCSAGSAIQVTTAQPLTFGSTFNVNTVSSGVTGATQFSVGTLSDGIFMPLIARRNWASTTIANLPVPVPPDARANISKSMAIGASTVPIVLAVYSSLNIPNYFTINANTRAANAVNVNTLAQNAVNAGSTVNAAQLLSLCVGSAMTAAREETLRVLLTNLRAGYDTNAIARAALQTVTASDVSTAVAGELFSLIAELDAKPLSVDAAHDAIEALVNVIDAAQLTGASSKFDTAAKAEFEAVASYIIQTGLQYIDDVLKATLQEAASLPDADLTAVGIGVQCKGTPSQATCRFWADLNVLRTDQVLLTNWWTPITGLAFTAGKNLIGAGVAPATGLFVTYISWQQTTPLDAARTDGALGIQTGMAKLNFANIAMNGGRAQVGATMTVGGTGQPVIQMRMAPVAGSTVTSTLGQYACLNRATNEASWSVQPSYNAPLNSGGHASCYQSLVSNKYVTIGRKTGSTVNVDDEGNPILTPEQKEKKISSGLVLGIVGMLIVGTVLVAGTAFMVTRWRRSRTSESSITWPKHEELEPTEEIDAGHRNVSEWSQVTLQPTSPLSGHSESSVTSPARQAAMLDEK